MNVRTQGDLLGRFLCRRIAPELILSAKTLQCSLLPVIAGYSAVLGAFMWFIGLSADIVFALGLLCVGAWIMTPPFVDLLIGMAARRQIGVAHYIVTSLLVMGGALLAAEAVMATVGTLVPPFFLAAALTGMCAPPPLLAYSMWHCRGRNTDRSPQS